MKQSEAQRPNGHDFGSANASILHGIHAAHAKRMCAELADVSSGSYPATVVLYTGNENRVLSRTNCPQAALALEVGSKIRKSQILLKKS